MTPTAGVEDLRGLGWSSIDNDTSKDLDQIEVAERVAGGIRLRVAIGDVAAAVELGSSDRQTCAGADADDLYGGEELSDAAAGVVDGADVA